MEPLAGDLHVDGLLSEISIAYMNDMGDYVADRAFPLVYTDKQSDKYVVYDDGWWFADEGDALRRAPGTSAREIGYAVTTSNSFYCDSFAVAKVIPDEDRRNADAPFSLDNEATQLVTQVMTIRRERKFAVDFMTTGVWGTDKTVANKWSDYGASDPFGDLEDGVRTIKNAVGKRPNKAVCGSIVWSRLKHHPDFIDRIKGGATTANPALLNRGEFARMAELEELLVGEAMYRNSNEGATVTKLPVIDDDLLLLYTPRTAGLYVPSAGYTFVWGSMLGGQRVPHMIRRIREERPMRDIVECHSYFDHKATATGAGYFFGDVVD